MRKLMLASFLFLASCGQMKQAVVTPLQVPRPSDYSKSVNYLKSKTVFESVDLNHDLKGFPETVRIDFHGGTLGDFCKALKFCTAESVLRDTKILPKIVGEFKLKKLLDKVALLTDTFWTNENGVIVFRRQVVVVYKIPLLNEDFSYIFGIENSSVKEIKLKLFKDIESLKDLLESKFDAEVNVATKYAYSSKNISSGRDLKKANEERENSTKSLSSDMMSKKKTKEDETLVKGEGEKREEGVNEKKKVTGIKLKEKGKVIPLTENQVSDSNKNLTKSVKKNEETGRNYKSVNEKRNIGSERNRKSRIAKEIVKEEQVNRENNMKKTVLKEISVKESKKTKEKFTVLPDLGLVVARVTPEEKRVLDKAIREVIRNFLSSVVVFDVYLVEMKRENSKGFSLSYDFFKRAYRKEAKISSSGGDFSVNFSSLAQNYLEGIAHGIELNLLINYLVKNANAKVVMKTTLTSLSNLPARVKSSVDYPYLEPEQVSIGGTNPTQSYKVKYISDGLEIRLSPAVVDNDIFVAISLYFNKVLEMKTLKAGNMGEFTLPVKSPRVVTSTLRCKPGDILVLGGFKRFTRVSLDSSGILSQNTLNREESRELYVFIRPRLVVFKAKIKNQIKEEVRDER